MVVAAGYIYFYSSTTVKLFACSREVNIAAEPPGVSCAAGGRLERGGPRQEAGTRQCACGRPLERQERCVAGSGWRLRMVGLSAGRSVLPGESRPAHEPRQRCPLHALVRRHGRFRWGNVWRQATAVPWRSRFRQCRGSGGSGAGAGGPDATARHGRYERRRRTPPRRRHAGRDELRGDSGSCRIWEWHAQECCRTACVSLRPPRGTV